MLPGTGVCREPGSSGFISLPQVRKCLWVCMSGQFSFHFHGAIRVASSPLAAPTHPVNSASFVGARG